MKRLISLILVLLLALGAGGGAFYQFIYKQSRPADGTRVSSDSEDAVYVDSVKMLAGLGGGSGVMARYAGVVEPQKTWEAKLENEKTVKETYVKEGELVKEGQKIFTYDITEDEDKLAEAVIELERLENAYETSVLALEKTKAEKVENTEEARQQHEMTVKMAELDLKNDDLEIRNKKTEIENLESAVKDADVFSELDGIVKSISNPNSEDSFSYSDNGSDVYMTIMAVGKYRVKGTVNEQNRNSIAVGMDMLVWSRVEDRYWSGTITEIKEDSGKSNQDNDGYGDSSGDSGSTNYPFYVELEDSDDLMLGQHVYLEVDQGQGLRKSGIWLPDYYFTTEEDGSSWVWAASDKNLLEKRSVELGRYDDKMATYEILSGLNEDDYITTPFDELSAGSPVIYIDYSDEDLSAGAMFDGGSTDLEDLYDLDDDDGSFEWFDGSLDWGDDGSYDMEFFEEGSFEWTDDDEPEWDLSDIEDENI